MDPLSNLVALLRPNVVVSKPITARGKWGVSYAAYGQPGYAIVLIGRCWLQLDGREPVRLERGDFVLLPSTPAFRMFSHPDAECMAVAPSETAMRHGEKEGEPDVRLLGGSFRIEPVNAPLLVALLPELIHVRSAEASAPRLDDIIGLIMEECASDLPGGDMILQRLLEVLLVESLRSQSIGENLPAGLLKGMRDPLLARALREMHSDVRAGWTVAALAKLAGMSRSAFAARFSEALGCAPIEYLARWRMALAQDALVNGRKTLEGLASEIGYESASAFSTAFRRRTGSSPGGFARRARIAKESTGRRLAGA